jgi:hypothetical protein
MVHLRGTILSFLRSDKKACIEEEITGDICPTVLLDKIVSNDVNRDLSIMKI